MSGWRRDLALGAVLLAAFAAVPAFGLPRFWITTMTVFFIWAIVVTQWNLVFGAAGIFSLAQMAIFAVGGYGTAMMGLYLGWSLWLALPLAGLLAVLFGTVVGLACLRLTGAYVALLTLAVAHILFLLIVTDTDCIRYEGTVCRSLTEGWKGLGRYGDYGFRDLLGRDFHLGNYGLALALRALATAFSFVIVRSPMGLAFRALRDNPRYAVSRGLSRFKYQLLVFACSAFFTGLAGSAYAGIYGVIGPNVLQLGVVLFLLSMMVVGGVGRPWGPLVGAALLMLVDEALKEQAFADYRNIGLGLILAAVVILLPQGIAGGLESLAQRLAGRRGGEGRRTEAGGDV